MASVTITATSVATALNVSANTLVKAGAGRIAKVNVTTAGSAAGTINDSDTVANAAAANLIFSIPNTVGSYSIEFPVFLGLVVKPGTGQIVSVSYI